MTFSPTFVRLQQEAYLAHGSLAFGLTSLRTAVFPDKGSFYVGFFNTSIGFERVMKLIVATDHMLQHGGMPPTMQELKGYGHDLVGLYAAAVSSAERIGVDALKAPQAGSLEAKILAFLSDFARWSRYYNLDALRDAPQRYSDPLTSWGEILDAVLLHDVPPAKVERALREAELLHGLLAGHMSAIQHGMSGNLLTLPEVFSTPAKQELAVPYAMVRLFHLLSPLLKTLGELGRLAFYGPPRRPSPLAPLFHEFFGRFAATDAEVRRKKRWP